ncbi:uncharacterized protein LOC111255475 isoform X3 [Varroa destructor]|nr:uncharacterized protein LOC111255475 isoform X3 [Varroa destructor]XP_022673214.1 uncharacterized protein LOC111255475 isoform X3 [Varroa destructor]XP_022673216.1 uncharacterized protein LOC111255475 isoform X3 [Varroa destructor]XP_022673217.1 uncharacterized protein LOC111255475 isoform X3 [Varroa destructor]XP_022673218.1 uncharacterized protein LOC111255475 isoform X3 [Varroa destructor]
MDTMELDFSNSGTVLIEKYTVNQLIYIARCMKEKKRFMHLIKVPKTKHKVDDSLPSSTAVARSPKVLKERNPFSTTGRSTRSLLRRLPNRKSQLASLADKSLKTVTEKEIESHSLPIILKESPISTEPLSLGISLMYSKSEIAVSGPPAGNTIPIEDWTPEKNTVPGENIAYVKTATPVGNEILVKNMVSVKSRTPCKHTKFVEKATSPGTRADINVPSKKTSPIKNSTPVEAAAPAPSVSAAVIDINSSPINAQSIPRNAVIPTRRATNITLPSKPLQNKLKVTSFGSSSSPLKSAESVIPKNDEPDHSHHIVEAVVRSLVNAVLVEEEERLARERGVYSTRNPFASTELQRYLKGNRNLKMTFLGLVAPNLDAAISPKRAVVSVLGTETVLLKTVLASSPSATKGALTSDLPALTSSDSANPSCSTTLSSHTCSAKQTKPRKPKAIKAIVDGSSNTEGASTCPAVSPITRNLTTSSVPAVAEKAKSQKRKTLKSIADKPPVIEGKKGTAVIGSGSTSSAPSITNPRAALSFIPASAVTDKANFQKQNVLKPQLVPPLRLKIPPSCVKLPTSFGDSERTCNSEAATSIEAAPEGLCQHSSVKNNFPHAYKLVDHSNDLEYGDNEPRQRSMMHRVKTTPICGTAISDNVVGTSQNPKAPDEELVPVVLHTSDARKSKSWDDEKASRLLRQSLLVIERGSRIAVTKYQQDFASLSLTLNSILYAASAVVTSDEIVRQSEHRRTQLLNTIAAVANEDHGNRDNINNLQRKKRLLPDAVLSEKQSPSEPVLKWPKVLGGNDSSDSITKVQEQQTAILQNNKTVSKTGLPLSPHSLSSSLATSNMTRRGRTVKRNSRLADYLVGECIMKKYEAEAEQRARARNRQVEMEYARQWHQLRSQLTMAPTLHSDNRTQQKRMASGYGIKDTELPLVPGESEGHALAEGIGSFTLYDGDRSDADDEITKNRFDKDIGRAPEQVLLPQKGTDQYREDAGSRVGEFNDEATAVNSSSENYGKTIAPVRFPVNTFLLKLKSRNMSRSKSASLDISEKANVGLPEQMRRQTAPWQQKLVAGKQIANCQRMHEIILDGGTGPDLPRDIKNSKVIIHPDVNDVTAEEIKALEELNNLLYNKPGVVGAEELLHDFRKSFCIEVRNQIQLLRYKKLLMWKNQRLKLKKAELTKRSLQNYRKRSMLIRAIRNTVSESFPHRGLPADRLPEEIYEVTLPQGSQEIHSKGSSQVRKQQQRQRQQQCRQKKLQNLQPLQSKESYLADPPTKRPKSVNSPASQRTTPMPKPRSSNVLALLPESNSFSHLKILAPSQPGYASDPQISSRGSLSSVQSPPIVPAVPCITNAPHANVRHVILSPPQSCRPPPTLIVHQPSPRLIHPGTSSLRLPSSTNPVVPISPIIPAGQIFLMMSPVAKQEQTIDEVAVVDVHNSDSPSSTSISNPMRAVVTKSVLPRQEPMLVKAVDASFSSAQHPRLIKKFLRIGQAGSSAITALEAAAAPIATTSVGSVSMPLSGEFNRPIQRVRDVIPRRYSHLPTLRALSRFPSNTNVTFANPLRGGAPIITPIKRHISNSTVNGANRTDVIETVGLTVPQHTQLSKLAKSQNASDQTRSATSPIDIAGGTIVGKRRSDKSFVTFTDQNGTTVATTLFELDGSMKTLARSTPASADELCPPSINGGAQLELQEQQNRQELIESTVVTTVSALRTDTRHRPVTFVRRYSRSPLSPFAVRTISLPNTARLPDYIQLVAANAGPVETTCSSLKQNILRNCNVTPIDLAAANTTLSSASLGSETNANAREKDETLTGI